MTEIAPGMMVECIYVADARSPMFRKRYFVKAIINNQCLPHYKCGGKCTKSLELYGIKNKEGFYGFALHCFKPIGGDKEIERQESKRTGKSAKDNIKNKELTNNYKFFVIDMDDK